MADISEAMVEAASEAYWNAATIISAPWTSQPAEQQHVVQVRMRAALEAALSAAPASAQMEGLSTWSGWDQARPPWGECKHKDAVLEALFRAPWSVEDAATLIGFIDRTWPVAAPLLTSEGYSNG